MSKPLRHRRPIALAQLLGLALACGAHAASPPPSAPAQTIGDLDSKAIPVQRDSKGPVGGAAKAMENYRQFLQL
jgi:hypothetical protein